MRLIQLLDGRGVRRVGVVDGDRLRLIAPYASVFALANAALQAKQPLAGFAERHVTDDSLSYDDVYAGRSEWRVLPAADHPDEPARCLISGTGLTHRRSAEQRQAMHAAGDTPTDSFRMYMLGEEGGRPAPGTIGTSPEWFYKGTGLSLRGHGDPLTVPSYAEDGGEEPEIAGVYLIDAQGTPRRLGMAIGNEFADHRLEQRNYLYLAHSKLRECAIGPELVLDPPFDAVNGQVSIERDGQVLWSREIRTGGANMCHSLANMEHHHFKYDVHRRPGDVHVHFFGADAFSFGAGLTLEDGDVMVVVFEGFGTALRNPVRVGRRAEGLVEVRPM